MNRRNLIIGIIILAIVAAVIYFTRKSAPQTLIESPQPTSTSQNIEDKFKVSIPSSAERITLSDDTGGNATGIAARDFSNDTFTLTVLADLPDLDSGSFYQAWIVKGADLENSPKLSLGRLSLKKGGYVIDFSVNKDYSDYNLVVVSKETAADSTIEMPILQGSF